MNQFELIEQRLINEFQHDFPCVERPYEEIAAKLGLSEADVLTRLGTLQDAGVISRIGPVFAPGQVGCSTLAALAVPPERFVMTADWISSLPETNHNYEREDAFNLWFVITAPDQTHLKQTIARIESHCPFPLLVLPLLEQFHIDLGFDLGPDLAGASTPRPTKSAHINPPAQQPLQMTPAQHDLVDKLQLGIPLVSSPYALLWPNAPDQVQFALEQIQAWKDSGVIKRFGVVVRHHELGYRENAMVVWDVPDAVVSDLGTRAATMPAVTLCYRRPRRMPQWPYNLFCMIHGKDRSNVEQRISDLCHTTGLDAYPMKILFSKRRFKQQGARYVPAG